MLMIRVGKPDNHAIIDSYRKAVEALENVGEYNRDFYEANLQLARVKLISLINAERRAVCETCNGGNIIDNVTTCNAE